jgi:histidine triad (HIT) family protein
VVGNSPATVVKDWWNAIAIVPLDPVVEGHLLVIPKRHITDFTENPTISGDVVELASELAAEIGGDFNLITSKGISATQSVFHLHIHLVPRRENDGLALPWYSGKKRKTPIQGSGYTASQLLGG